MRSKNAAGVAIGIAALLAMCVQPAWADGPINTAEDPPPAATGTSATAPTTDAGVDGAVAPDELVAAYATSKGITIESARARIIQEESLASAMSRVGAVADGPTADVWINDQGDQLVLHVRSTDARTLADLESAAASAGVLIVEDRRPALVSERTDLVHQKASDLVSRVEGLVGFYIDPRTGKLVLDVAINDDDARTQVAADAVDAATLAENLTGLPSVINLIVSFAGDTATVNGGVALTGCTAGFMANYTAGTTTYQGFLTAAHCGTSVSYYYGTNASGTLKAATFSTQNYGSSADIAFHILASGDSASSAFFGSSPTTVTTQGTVSSASVGNTVCRRGLTMGSGCGVVQSTQYTPAWANACNGSTCNAVFVSTNQPTWGGDSGGPVWLGTNSPVGIHKGGSSGDSNGVGAISVYSKLTARPAGTTLR